MLSFSSILDSTLESLDSAEESVRRIVAEAGFDEGDTYFIALAVREILANAIKHGNRFDPGKKVDLHLTASDTELIVEVKDQGEGFRLEDVPDPRLPENLDKPSGRGIIMAKGIMDDCHIEPDSPGGTYVRMSKRLPASS